MAQIIQRDTHSVRLPDVTVTVAQVVVIPPINLLRFDKKCFSVKNLGSGVWATGKLQATSIEVPGEPGVGPGPSTDPNDWEDMDTATFATLAPNAFKSKQFSADSHKWWRMVATVNTTASICRPYIDAGSI